MKIIISLLALTVFSSSATIAQNENKMINQSIVKFFDGLSEIDPVKLKAYATADFMLLENGEIWNMDTLVSKIGVRKNSNITRVNKFRFINTALIGNAAWVSYYNTAEITFNEKQQTIRWLESAVLRKENGIWKIQLLHSTKLK
jgi:hypothetical protein